MVKSTGKVYWLNWYIQLLIKWQIVGLVYLWITWNRFLDISESPSIWSKIEEKKSYSVWIRLEAFINFPSYSDLLRLADRMPSCYWDRAKISLRINLIVCGLSVFFILVVIFLCSFCICLEICFCVCFFVRRLCCSVHCCVLLRLHTL